MSQPSEARQAIILQYQRNIEHQENTLKHLKKEKNIIAYARLLVALCGIASTWYVWSIPLLAISSLVIFSSLLIILIIRDADKTREINNCERLAVINKREIYTMSGNLKLSGLEDGLIFADPLHPYAADLDLFGESSLFQWLNRCHSEQSKELLAFCLKNPELPHNVLEKQLAAKELAGKQESCQQFQSIAMADPLTHQTEKKILTWLSLPVIGYQAPIWKWFQYLYIPFPIAIFTLYTLGRMSIGSVLLCLAGFYVFHFLVCRKILPDFAHLLNIEPEMNALGEQLVWIEMEQFHAPFLQALQNKLKPSGYASASASIGDFNSILKKIDWRENLLINAILQLFFLWDLRLKLLMNNWKKKNQDSLAHWIHTLAEMELCISLASVAHNEPDWCFPEIDENYFHLETFAMGHPLIQPEKRVTNDFFLEGQGKIALITGSNMAGKSTFLRTIGTNVVLAQMGSPVCARGMKLSSVKLLSSMRVADNLAENTSTFFAELTKLKCIVEAVNHSEPALILLDEVLRGTNSRDRHRGTQALMRQLIRQKAVTLMATHDTELAQSEAEDKSVSNYHFEGEIHDNELYFDYKIRTGICETFNATTLMKKIGIHFDD